MRGFKLGKELARRTDLSSSRIFQTLTDSLFCVSLCGYIEQALVCFGILHHGGGSSVDCKYERALALPEMLHELAGRAAERGQ
jgi:hypothetical protein